MPSDTEQLGALVRAQIEELLGDPVRRAELLGMQPFGPDQAEMLDYHDSVIRSLLSDRSLGRVLNGPLWLSGASVVDGTVTASKLIVNTLESITVNTGSLNVTGTITAAMSFPATGARVTIGSAGVWGYNGPTTTTFRLNTDGSGSIGIGSTAMSWDTSGVVSIPKAAIGSLTIADIGGGVVGGTYQTASGTTRIELSSTGMRALNSGVEYFNLDSVNATLTLTGRFTVKSASSGARVEILATGGIAGYYDNTNTSFVLNTSGTGRLGPASGSNNIAWDSTGVSIGGVALSGGKITASHLSVSSLSAISANLGTITAGSITGGTISATTITTGTLQADRISGGTLGGGFNIGGANTVVTAGGKLQFGNDYITDNLIQFFIGTSQGAHIAWASETPTYLSSGSVFGYIGSSNISLGMQAVSRNSSGTPLFTTTLAVESTSTYGRTAIEALTSTQYASVYVEATSSTATITLIGKATFNQTATFSSGLSASGTTSLANLTVNGTASFASLSASGTITGSFRWPAALRGTPFPAGASLTRYIQIFDESGNAWGVVPVYTT